MRTKIKVGGLLVALASVAAAYAVTVCEIADCKNTCVYRGTTICVMAASPRPQGQNCCRTGGTCPSIWAAWAVCSS